MLANFTRHLVILDCGRCEFFKSSIHGVLGILATTCAAYNIAAFCSRRKPHLAINALVYSALIVLEYKHVQHHLDSSRNPVIILIEPKL